jgi:signal transduction histidine kinase
MLEVKWPVSLKPYFDLYWFFTLAYCLPFSAMLMFLASQQNYSALMGLAVALLTLVVCVDWQTFLILSGMGITSAIVGYRLFTGHFLSSVNFDMAWSLVTTLGTVLVAGFFFSRRKELYSIAQLTKAKLYAGSIAHETKNYLGVAFFAGNSINQAIQNHQFKPLEELEEGAMQDRKNLYVIPKDLAEELMYLGPELTAGGQQSLSKIDMFMQALREDIISAKLTFCSIKACTQEALTDTYFKQEEVKAGLVLKLDDDFKATVPQSFFKHIIYNIVKNAYYHGGASQVVISLDSARCELYIQDNGRGISSVSLPYIFDLFYSGGHSTGIGLALVKIIVESFGGTIHCTSKQGEGSYTKFTIAFPEKT